MINIAKNFPNAFVIKGGNTRNFSTFNALSFIEKVAFRARDLEIFPKSPRKKSADAKNSAPKIDTNDLKIIIHDAALPLITQKS